MQHSHKANHSARRLTGVGGLFHSQRFLNKIDLFLKKIASTLEVLLGLGIILRVHATAPGLKGRQHNKENGYIP